MNLHDAIFFMPEGMKPEQLLHNTKDASTLVTAWMLSEDSISDDGEWLVNECAYFGIKKEEAASAIATGFTELFDVLCPCQAEVKSRASVRLFLQTYNALLLRRITQGNEDRDVSLSLPALRVLAQRCHSPQRTDEQQLLFEAHVRTKLSENWAENMAHVQQKLFWKSSEAAGERVQIRYQELFDSLVPGEMQNIQLVKKLILSTSRYLASVFPDDVSVWEAVAESFISTLTMD